MQPISLKDLLEAGCHFGHKSDRWQPKAASFIYQKRDGIHVIDLVKTKAGLEAAANFVKTSAASGKILLFLGTKRQAAPIIKAEAEASGAPYFIKRWVGGFLTNWSEVHKNLEKIRRLTEEETNGAWNKFPKHERVKLSRYLAKLNQFYGGVAMLKTPPDILFVVDIKTEAVAVAEARKRGTTVIGVVDTNANPTDVDYVIPSNDDAVGAIKLIVTYIARAYKEGAEAFQKEQNARAEELKKIPPTPAKTEAKKVEEVQKVEAVKPTAAKKDAPTKAVEKVKAVKEVTKEKKKA
jgi:small subunit ribosomal protein S2